MNLILQRLLQHKLYYYQTFCGSCSGLAQGSLFSWPVLPSLRTAVADSHPKIDEASPQRVGVAVFYLLSPHNAFMTTDIYDKVLKNWAEA